MVDDPQDKQDYNENNDSGGGRRSSGGSGIGGGGILNFLPLLLSLFGGGGSKKGIIILLLVVGDGYFLLKNQSCGNIANAASAFAKGGTLDPDEFKKASVYEGLSDDATKNPLPEAVSLEKFAPTRKNQGQQGSCVAWSSAYAARSIIESAGTATDPNTVAF